MRKFLFLLSFVALFLSWKGKETYIISGTLLDSDIGDPLIGASILEKGTTNGTVSNINGFFQFEISQKCSQIDISYTGYSSKTIKVCAGDTVNVKLEQAMVLDEVVVISSSRKSSKIRGKKRSKKPKDNPVMIRGSRANATEYYIDGVRVNGSLLNSNSSGIAKEDSEKQAFNTEDYSPIEENRFLKATKNPLSTFSIDVDAASYSNMRRFINAEQQPPKDAIRIEEMVNYFTYDYPQPEGDHPFSIINEISECPWATNHKLVHIGLQGRTIPTDHLPASNLVFLIDVSGSMNSPNKLPLLRSSFKLLTEQLREQDRVAIVVYAGAAGLVLPSTSGYDKQTIVEALNQLSAGGSTAGGAGIKLAYKVARQNFIKGGNNRVILATDGDFNIGASSDAAMVELIEKERKSGVFLTVLGFGMGNYKDNKMQQLADKGNGNHAYIDSEREAKKIFINEFGGTLFTIAKDVKIQVEFNPTLVQGYRLIGYENRMLAAEDFKDDTKDAGELGSGHTVTALYEIIPTGVKTELLAEVDNLKYQQAPTPKNPYANEIMTVKLRYKQPEGSTSTEIVQAVQDRNIALEESSDNFRWSAAVAQFGMVLRDSDFKGTGSFAKASKLAKGAKGKDKNGYRKEFIQLIQKAQSFGGENVVGNK